MPSDGTVDPEINAPDGDAQEILPVGTPVTRPAGRLLNRRELVTQKQAQSRRNRPFIIGGFVLFIAILALPIYAYINNFVLPPREVAVQVNDAYYTRGDVVDFVRFHQRLALEAGEEFRITDQLLTALETISENEIAYQKAPLLSITVTEEEIQSAIRETIGFPGLTSSMAAESNVESDISEAFRQLLNRIQLSEDAYSEIIKKSLFREKARRELQRDVPLLQPQVHLYALEFKLDTDPGIERSRKRLATGDSIAQVAIDLSQELAVARTQGDLGWVPQFVLPDRDVEDLIFGLNENGQKNLLPNTLSESQWDGESAVYRYYYIDEVSDARELDQEDLDTITDHSLAVWLEDQRVLIEEYKLRFDSDIFEWIGTQVLNTNITVEGTATPLPGTGPVDIGDLLSRGN